MRGKNAKQWHMKNKEKRAIIFKVRNIAEKLKCENARMFSPETTTEEDDIEISNENI